MTEVIGRIKALHPTLEQLKEELRADLNCFPDVETVHTDAAYWKTRILFDTMVKLRLFFDNNFHIIETMGVLALTRYVFELSVILKNINAEANFVFLYVQKMKRQECEHFEEYLRHIESEIALYKSMEAAENAAYQKIIAKDPPTGKMTARNSRRIGKKVSQAMKRTSDFLDKSLEFQFTLYADDAARNGYGFQAHLMEQQIIPQVQKKLEEARDSYDAIKSTWKDRIAAFDGNFQRWRWKEMAVRVHMQREYDFIYSYTSRLLHALPHGLTTDQKNLEESEVLMFLKYVEAQMRWVVGFAQGKADKRRQY